MKFEGFLRSKKIINDILNDYKKSEYEKDTEKLDKLKKQKIGNFAALKKKYFKELEPLVSPRRQKIKNENKNKNKNGKNDKDANDDFQDEIAWLFTGCETEYELCKKIFPFWSDNQHPDSIIKEIYSFMESTEEIQGNYEIKAAEFGQLKHTLQVNDELALELFHIIRFKIRSLTWRQMYQYFEFILKMKYRVQNAILQSSEAEDTTVSIDGIKRELKISVEDESNWLFNKVDSLHGAIVTWKQISKYISKMVTVRDQQRDFFNDFQRDSQFEDKKAEMIHFIYKKTESNQEEIKSMVKNDITKRLNGIKHELNKHKNGDNKLFFKTPVASRQSSDIFTKFNKK